MDPISLIFAIGVIGYVGFHLIAVVIYLIADLIPSRATRLARARGRVLLLEAQAAKNSPEPTYNPESWYDSVLLCLSPSMRAEFLSLDDPQRSSTNNTLSKWEPLKGLPTSSQSGVSSSTPLTPSTNKEGCYRT